MERLANPNALPFLMIMGEFSEIEHAAKYLERDYEKKHIMTDFKGDNWDICD